MFIRNVQPNMVEISHKRVEHPVSSVYYNHIHSHCEILLFVSGSANYNIDGQIFTPSPYDLIFIPAAKYHYLVPTASVPYENYVIGVEPKMIAREHYEKLFSPPLMLSVKNDSVLLNYFKLLELYDRLYSEKDFAICAQALIHELITYCYYQKNTFSPTNGEKVLIINDIIAFIEQNIENPLNADTISSHFLISKSYIQNIFSTHMHIGLKQYIMQKKIYSAHIDLSRGMTSSDVCEKYKFGDYTNFYRLYKKTFGVPPSANKLKGDNKKS